MSKEVSLIILGVLTALTPFMGLPGEWRTVLLIIFGFAIAIIGFFLRSETLARGGGKGYHFFVDNRQTDAATPNPSESSGMPIRIP